MRWFDSRRRHLFVLCDAAVGDGKGEVGLGVVVQDGDGRIVGLAQQRQPRMTNNEAEYAALVLGLESAGRFGASRLTVLLDSEIVVGQMLGAFCVRSPALKPWHRRACQLVRRYACVDIRHIPRTHNRIADALASEALQGRLYVRGGEL